MAPPQAAGAGRQADTPGRPPDFNAQNSNIAYKNSYNWDAFY